MRKKLKARAFNRIKRGVSPTQFLPFRVGFAPCLYFVGRLSFK